MNEVSTSGTQSGYSARPFYSANDIAAKDAAETASFAGQRAKEASFRQAHAAGGSDPASQYQAIAALHDRLFSRMPGSSLDLAHPLFSDGSSSCNSTPAK